jgi:hypothetical protein
MLQEYAVDPILLTTWEKFQSLISHFQFENGRRIATYPKRWKKLVIDSIDDCDECESLEKTRIVEALRRVDGRLVPHAAKDWDDKLCWLENAKRVHPEFFAIVTQTGDPRVSNVLPRDEIDDTIDYSSLAETDRRLLWRSSSSSQIFRNAKSMADAIDLLLKKSRSISFIDPHFAPEMVRYQRPFAEFMKRISERSERRSVKSIYVHCSAKATLDAFTSKCEKHLAPHIPTGCSVVFCRWNEEGMHNRYVLSDLAGYMFGHGLDESTHIEPQEDTVTLLKRTDTEYLLEKHCSLARKHEMVDSLTVNGSD